MRHISILAAIAALLLVGIWGCGGDDSTGPGGSSATEADYAAWGMITTFDWGGVAKRTVTLSSTVGTMVMAAVQKNNGTEDVSTWPYQEADEVKLIDTEDITLGRFPFGDDITYTLEGDQTLTPGETYRLRMTVEGRTFTSKKAARVLDALQITTEDEQHIDLGASFTVEWNAVGGAGGYGVSVTSPSDDVDTTFVVGKTTQKALPGELFGENGEYAIAVTAYDENIAPYAEQWESQSEGIPVYGFDDPKILGTFFSMAVDEIYVWVGSGGGNGGNGGNGGTPGQMDVTVSGGTTPTINWTGGNASALTVMTAAVPTLMWGLVSTSPSGIAPPVVYGQPPGGAMQLSAAQPLEAGIAYQVFITGVTVGTAGEKSFTP